MRIIGIVLGLVLVSSCTVSEPEPTWTVELETDQGAYMSVWGSAETDVWVAGGTTGRGLLSHYDGLNWSESVDDAPELLNWVYGFSATDVFAVGEHGLILHFDGNDWRQVSSGTNKTLYGVWGTGAADVWIVGGAPQGNEGDAVILHGTRDGFAPVNTMPAQLLPSSLYKVYGGPQGLVAVGTNGTVMRERDGAWSRDGVPTRSDLFSLWGRSDSDVYAVGGQGTGEILRYDGSSWSKVEARGQGLSGVFTAPGQPVIAVGHDAYVLELNSDGSFVEPELPIRGSGLSLHGVWGDESGSTFAVGGDLFSYPDLGTGVVLRRE